MGLFSFLKRKKAKNIGDGEFVVVSPVDGEIQSTAVVPDEAFSTNALGKGFAVVPENDTFCAPISGVITLIAETAHAFSIKSKEGYEVLVHIGIDTVNLNINRKPGEPLKAFTILVEQGTEVTVGTPIIKANINEIKNTHNLQIFTPVVVLFNDATNKKTISEPLVTGHQPAKTPILTIKE